MVKDKEMVKLSKYVVEGWPEKMAIGDEAKEFWNVRQDIEIVGKLALKNNRLVITWPLRKRTLELLHKGHQGIEKMKRRARQGVFWPNMDTDIEGWVKKCV